MDGFEPAPRSCSPRRLAKEDAEQLSGSDEGAEALETAALLEEERMAAVAEAELAKAQVVELEKAEAVEECAAVSVIWSRSGI